MRTSRRLGQTPSHRRERGSMAVEFVVAAPALVLLLLVIAGGGQWLNLTGEVNAAARDASRAASFARSYNDAQQNATNAARADLGSICQGGLTVP
ncbi:MAG TPA: TadE/TadG family type IV pilus assembly protein, partial [Streptosporangiaceae bacterium]